MDTLQISAEIAKDLIRLGALSSRELDNSDLEDGQVHRLWVDEFAKQGIEILESTRRTILELTKSASEVQGGVFLDSIDVLMQEFQTSSLRTTQPTPAAVRLLLHRIMGFLASSFRELAEIALALGHAELRKQCQYAAKAIARPGRRDVPYAAPDDYKKYLRIFAELSAAADPMVQLLMLSEANSVPRKPRAPPPRERGRDEPDVGKPDLEISTPIIPAGILDEAEPRADRTYRVWFGTNRAPLQPADPALGFSSVIDLNKLYLGSCLVFVPQSHIEGSLGSSWVRRTFMLRADDRLRLTSIRVLEREIFQERITAEMASRPKGRSALVFVHGFNVRFEDAALRAAQLACDLTVDGVTAFYSWPSAGEVRYYPRDEETIRATTSRFLEFLDTLLEIHGLERVDIIAHSMGNRLVAAALKELASSARRNCIGHLVLAAPDVGRVEFTPMARHYTAAAKEAVTLYSCAHDRALRISSKIHDYLRIGYEPPIYIHDGIDTISATRIKMDLLGHGYFAASKPLIADLKKLLWANLKPAQRGLVALPDEATPEYWVLKAK
ncbi:MAG: alpha/beta hydrolase [Hyphomicrobiaceae bacterium]